MKLLLLAFVSALLGMASAWSRCPRPEDLLPCTCIRPRGYTVVTCEGSKQEIDDGFKRLSLYWLGVDNLVVKSDEVQQLTNRTFGYMDLHMLSMYTPGLKSFAKDAFRTNERAFNHLRIYQSAIENLQDILPSLKDVFRLFSLVINHSPLLTSISAHEFDGQFKPWWLTNLDLSHNAIETIGDGAFQALVRLDYINLSGNKISTFAPSVIRSGNRLRILDLVGNRISSFPIGLIYRINKGQQIKLQNNTITTIPLSDIRAAAERYVHVFLEGNKIVCDKHFKVIALMNEEHRGHLLHGTCDSPMYLHGITFHQLNTSFFTD